MIPRLQSPPVALLFALLALTASAAANPPLRAVPPPPSTAIEGGSPCGEAHSLDKTAPAPCDGVLWPSPWTVRALRCIEVALPTCRQNTQLNQELCLADKTALFAKNTACNLLVAQQNVLLDSALDTLEPTPWWKSPAFIVPVSIIGGVALGFTAAIIADRLGAEL